MRPFWEQMIKNKKKGKRKLIIYPILIEVEPNYNDDQIRKAAYSFLVPYTSGTTEGKTCPVYSIPS
jgi:hypothetical protein